MSVVDLMGVYFNTNFDYSENGSRIVNKSGNRCFYQNVNGYNRLVLLQYENNLYLNVQIKSSVLVNVLKYLDDRSIDFLVCDDHISSLLYNSDEFYQNMNSIIYNTFISYLSYIKLNRACKKYNIDFLHKVINFAIVHECDDIFRDVISNLRDNINSRGFWVSREMLSNDRLGQIYNLDIAAIMREFVIKRIDLC